VWGTFGVMRAALAFCFLATVLAGPPVAAQELPGAPAPTKVSVNAVPNPASFEMTPAASGELWRWRVLRTAWTEQDERAYEEFVARIGESGCKTVHECLTDARSNPLYRASNPADMRFYADCADLPYMLRAYFAWKNGLPFAYSAAVAATGRSHDARYNTTGNHISSRRDLTSAIIDARQVIPQMIQAVTSAHYRYAPDYSGKLLPDHYPVQITRESIKPGTILYDPNGHLAVVYKVTPEGRVHFIDAHPDNSLTRGVYGKAYKRDTPAVGAGFKRWRPQTLIGATQQPDGSYQGGRIVLTPDRQLPDWSDEQFFGTERNRPKAWEQGRFVHGGETLEYYEFVRKRLANANFKYDPLEETRSMVRALCNDLKYRVDAVDAAVRARINQRPQPDRLPDNIYGTSGDWEIYSTPSRDARLRTAFKELRDEVARFLDLAAQGSTRLAYSGKDLPGDLRKAYTAEANACLLSYTRSNGSQQPLTLVDVTKRLPYLSFDPYHCVERRWGAREQNELATCTDGAEKADWYAAEQRLRNQIDRTYDVRMNFSLGDLRRRAPGSGVDEPPRFDVLELLGTAVANTAQSNPA
jgi:HAMP domain-containing protein